MGWLPSIREASFTVVVDGSSGSFIQHVMPHQKPKYSRVISANRRREARINYQDPAVPRGTRGPIMLHMFLCFR